MPKSKRLQAVLYNWPVKILSFITALLLFLVIQMVSVSERTFSVPFQIDLPADFQVESSVPDGVRVTVTGPEEQIYRILPEQLAVSADFSDITEPGTYERSIVISPDGIELRADMLSFSSDPKTVKIYFSEAAGTEDSGDSEQGEPAGGNRL